MPQRVDALPQLAGNTFDAVQVEVDHCDRVAVAVQTARDRLSQAARRPGDDGDAHDATSEPASLDFGVDALLRLLQRPATAARADGEDLGHDRESCLLLRVGADVEPARA